MQIHYTEFGTFIELTTQSERDEFVNFFFKKLEDVIQQNHIHKYKNAKQIENILNYVVDELGLEITFKYKKDPSTITELKNHACHECVSTNFVYVDEEDLRIFYCQDCGVEVEVFPNSKWCMYSQNKDINFLDEVFRRFKYEYRHNARDF